jgi:hypothetical protein
MRVARAAEEQGGPWRVWNGTNTGKVTAELYKVRTGIDASQVMYKGSAETFNDLYKGQIDLARDAMERDFRGFLPRRP